MRLYQGDCLEVMRGQIPDNSIDLTVTSPPYDELRTYNGFSFDWKVTLEELFRVTKPGGAVVWIVADQTKGGSESGTSFRQALYAMECGFKLHDTMIWDKGGVTFPDCNRYFNCFEYMFVFSKGKPKAANMITDRKNKHARSASHSTYRQYNGTLKGKNHKTIKDYGRRFNVWHMPPCQSNKERTGHPAQMPIALARDHIISWSNPGETVFDPFLGSGTTGVAAVNTGRNFIGIELDAQYFRIAQERIAKAEEQSKWNSKTPPCL